MNEPRKRPTVTRKEIAEAAGISDDQVKRKQAEWGLNSCRSVASKSPIIFFRDKASELLIRIGVINKPL